MLNCDRLKSTAIFRLLKVYSILMIESLLAVLIGFGLVMLGLTGVAWMLGGIAAGAIVISSYRTVSHEPIQPNRNARKAGQLLIGLTIGLSLQHRNLSALSSHLFVFLGLPVFLMLAGALIGVVYSRVEKTDLLTGLLATTPGNIGVMASIAAEYTENTALVSLVQLMRFTTVVAGMPLLANVAFTRSNSEEVAAIIQSIIKISWTDLQTSLGFIGITLIAVYFGTKLRIPIAAFLCAIAVGLIFDLLPLVFPILTQFDFQLPIFFNLIGQILLGITIGEYWGINPRLKILSVVRSIVPVGLMSITAFLAALIIRALTQWDWLTCLLVASPGGSPEMIWIALTLQQDTEIVTAGHLVRLLTINLSLPLLLALVPMLKPEIHESATPVSVDR
ncbi:MAG: AbrB family transcriptional regulator [Leptolyngbya sp. Prado105]|nr:AbrB family transcriptional regulator [Leptolyngbya sp. Prado105]